MKHVLETEQDEEDVMEDLELFQFIIQAMEGVASNDSAVVGEKLNNIQERRKALIAKVMSVKDELGKLQKDYDSLLIETDTSINKAQVAFTMSKGAEKEVEELAIELQRLKEAFDLANATCQDAEERKKNTLMACDEDRLSWEKDLRQSDKELNQISLDLCSFQELQSKHDTSAIILLNVKNELAACLGAKLIGEAREQESGTHKPMQEEVIVMLKNELEEHRKSIAKVTDELCVLKATAELLKSQLNEEKAALATTQQAEAMASVIAQSLMMDIKLSQQELEAVHAKAQERRDRMDKVLQDASQEVDEAKVITTKAQEGLRKTKEEVEQMKGPLSTVQFRLEAVLRDIQAAKESERLALNTLRTLEDSMVVGDVKQVSSQMITLDLDDYTSLVQKSRQTEEELVHEKTAAAIAQVEAAKESESCTLSRLNEISKTLEEQKQALAAATERAGRATEDKLAMEQELKKWREKNGKRRRKAGEAPKPEARPSSSAAVAEIVGGDTKCAGKDDSCAATSVHPVSDTSGRSSPIDVALQAKTKKAKKLSFPRVSKFLGCWAGSELRSLSFRM